MVLTSDNGFKFPAVFCSLYWLHHSAQYFLTFNQVAMYTVKLVGATLLLESTALTIQILDME